MIQGDVGAPEDNARAVEEAIEALGPLRYLVANAANGSFGLTSELTVEQWDQTMAAHVRALLTLAQAARPSMADNGGGAIVAISSLGADRVYDSYAAFTDLFKEIPEWEAIAAAAGERSPLGRALDPDEIGDVVGFFLSDDARMVTGQTLTVDAGFTLPG